MWGAIYHSCFYSKMPYFPKASLMDVFVSYNRFDYPQYNVRGVVNTHLLSSFSNVGEFIKLILHVPRKTRYAQTVALAHDIL